MLMCIYAYAHKQFVLPTVAKQGQRMPRESVGSTACIAYTPCKRKGWLNPWPKHGQSSHCVAATTSHSQQYHQLLYSDCHLIWLSHVSSQPAVLFIPWWGDACSTCPSVFCGASGAACHLTAWIPLDVCVVGPAGGRCPLLSCSAVLLSSSCGSSALWIHLLWGCRTGLICSCLWHSSSGKGIERRAGEGFFPSSAENLTWNNICILPRKYWLQSR